MRNECRILELHNELYITALIHVISATRTFNAPVLYCNYIVVYRTDEGYYGRTLVATWPNPSMSFRPDFILRR